jgi:hypothetical protein
MVHEGFPELLGVVVGVLGEEEHDDDPHIVRSDLEISVVEVGLVESLIEAIGIFDEKRAILSVAFDLVVAKVLSSIPKILTIFLLVSPSLFWLECLDVNCLESLVDRSDFQLLLLLTFSFLQPRENFVEKQWIKWVIFRNHAIMIGFCLCHHLYVRLLRL